MFDKVWAQEWRLGLVESSWKGKILAVRVEATVLRQVGRVIVQKRNEFVFDAVLQRLEERMGIVQSDGKLVSCSIRELGIRSLQSSLGFRLACSTSYEVFDLGTGMLRSNFLGISS